MAIKLQIRCECCTLKVIVHIYFQFWILYLRYRWPRLVILPQPRPLRWSYHASSHIDPFSNNINITIIFTNIYCRAKTFLESTGLHFSLCCNLFLDKITWRLGALEWISSQCNLLDVLVCTALSERNAQLCRPRQKPIKFFAPSTSSTALQKLLNAVFLFFTNANLLATPFG